MFVSENSDDTYFTRLEIPILGLGAYKSRSGGSGIMGPLTETTFTGSDYLRSVTIKVFDSSRPLVMICPTKNLSRV